MKNYFKKIAALLLAALLLAGLSACVESGDGNDSQTAVSFQGEKISAEEAKLYVYTTQYDTEKLSEVMIAMYYGSYESFWGLGYGEKTYADYAVDNAIARLLQTKILVKKAKADGVSLDAEDEQKIQEALTSFREEYHKVIEKAGASDALTESFIRENALANKEYLELTKNIDTTFDDAAMRRVSGEGLSVYAKDSYTEKTDEDDEDSEGETIDIPEAEQDANREAAVMYFMDGFLEEIPVQDMIDDYEDAKFVTMVNVTPISASPENAVEEGKEMENYLQKMWTMKTGDLEKFEITNSSGKKVDYILHCLNDDDPELRKQAEEEELASRRKTKFEEEYAKLAKKYKRYHVYEKVVGNIKITEPLYESQYMSTGE